MSDHWEEWTVEGAIRRTGVLKEGHFVLSSGRHSGQFMQCAQMLQYPREAEQAGRALAKRFRSAKVDAVVGPALGGVVIAHETARALNVRCLFAERKEGQMTLRRGFTIRPGERVLVIEDVVTTGGSVQEVVTLMKNTGAEIVGIGSVIDRSGGRASFDPPFQSLLQHTITSYSPEGCPLCRQGIPVEKPGTRQTLKG
ncbi:orotate phosphoribosyltransferase [Paludifilum halophilum]|nr:orotate phosphoribosyltransferase [Paludifilum halophilum]